MAVPDFQSLMLPLLRYSADGRECSLASVRDGLAQKLGLSERDLSELLPSGRAPRFYNRVAWAKVYLVQAGLLTATRRGHVRISDRGRGVLQHSPDRIDIKFLGQFAEFREFRSSRAESSDDSGGRFQKEPPSETETPEEALEDAHLLLRASLAIELLLRIKSASPDFFERLVVELLLKMGYGGSRSDAGQAVGKAGDEGIDGIISEDRLGLDVVYLQAKRWEGTVGRPEIQKFVGALHGKRARKGVFITTGSFSADGIAYVEHIEPRVVLVDGRRLAELMIDFEVGVTTIRTFHVKRIDSDYFDEE